MQRETLESISRGLDIVIWVCLGVAAASLGGMVVLYVLSQ